MTTLETFDIDVSGTTIHGRTGGNGPPLLLLHGIPENNRMWDKLLPTLVQDHAVVATDLRGYGNSGTPPSDDEHSPYSMRTLAIDQVEVMAALGHDRFAVVGHDRGARCAYRMALDHADTVTALCVMDIVPTGHAFHHAGMEFALGYWVWSFLAVKAPLPERMIGADPAIVVDYMLDNWSTDPTIFDSTMRMRYTEQFRNPDRVHAICEQYRAAASLDIEHDDADRENAASLVPHSCCGAPKVPCQAGTRRSQSGANGPSTSREDQYPVDTSCPKSHQKQ